MQLNETNLPKSKISPAKVGDKQGFSLFGMWLNGSDSFKTSDDLYNHLMGREILLAKSGKSLFIGDPNFVPAVVDFDGLRSVITKKTAVKINYAELADLL